MPTATAQTVTTQVSFLSPTLKEKPYFHTYKDESNIVKEEHDIKITDLRSLPESELAGFTTDTSGFQWVHGVESVLKEDDFFDDEKVKTVYYAEVDAFLKKFLGAKRTQIFDHTTRRARPAGVTEPDVPGNRGPAVSAHVDQTPKAGAERVFLHLGEDAERLSKGRAQIVNIWRPIRGPVVDYPLTVADYRSIKPEVDLQATDLKYPHRDGETYSVRFGEHQRWYYVSNQQPGDVLLLKCYESEVVPGRALLTPHTAFKNPNAKGDELPRQSIEVRTLVFYSE